MLRKLMKYEIKATGRTLLPFYCSLLVFALFNKLLLFSSFSVKRNIGFLYAIASGISIFSYGAIMTAMLAVTLFTIVQRFYKNLLGTEGYLMNTLPVETYKNILSKLLIAAFWSIISCIVALLSIFIMFGAADSLELLSINLLPNTLDTFNKYGFTPFILCIEFFIASLLSLCKIILMIYASISIGHLFNKSKILWSFGSFISLSIIENIINFFFGKFEITKLSFVDVNASIFIEKAFLIIIIISIIYIIIYFIITNYILKNKLNLE